MIIRWSFKNSGHNMDTVLNKKSPKPLWFGLF